MVDEHFPKNIDIPLRILKTLKGYCGKDNIVKIWEYASIKEYTLGFPSCPAFSNKIIA